MPTKRKLNPGEIRCELCNAILKDDFSNIVILENVREIIDKTNDALKGIFWVLHMVYTDKTRHSTVRMKRYTLVKLVLRQKKNKTLHVDKWWEAEFIVEGALSVDELLLNCKKFWKEHPLDTFSKEAKEFQAEQSEKDVTVNEIVKERRQAK